MIADEAVAARARRAGLCLSAETTRDIARHAREVLGADPRLHLTTITDPVEFVERHVGESLEGAALLPADADGLLLDLGSGNGFPALPIGLVRTGLRVVLAEASERKAAFLEELARELAPGRIVVLHGQVQRPPDLDPAIPDRLAVITSRAMGNWARVLPRMVPRLRAGGVALLWAGAEVETIGQRAAWRSLRVRQRQPLPGRERSWIWVLERADKKVGG